MSDCTGYFTPLKARKTHAKAPEKITCRLTISQPTADWVQFGISDGAKTGRLSIPMSEFERLVVALDERMQAVGQQLVTLPVAKLDSIEFAHAQTQRSDDLPERS